MKVVSNEFKNALKQFGRELDSVIEVYSSLKLSTENNLTLLTQDKLEIVGKDINLDDSPTYTINNDNLFQIKLITNGQLLSTLMKELDFETSLDLDIGSIVKFKFGVKVNEQTGEYEYIDYGKFIIYKKEFNHDTKTYTYICYDYMLKTMVLLNDDFNLSYNNYEFAIKSWNYEHTEITEYYMQTKNIIELICSILNINVDIKESEIQPLVYANLFLWGYLEDLPNTTSQNKSNNNFVMTSRIKTNNEWVESNVNFETIRNKCKTFRDVLDLICKFMGISMYMEDDTLRFKSVEGHKDDEIVGSLDYSTFEWNYTYDTKNPQIVATFDESVLRDNNIIFEEKYGPINAINMYMNDNIKTYVQDSQSVEDDGLTLVNIENYFRELVNAQQNNDEITNNLFATINGVSYNTFDIKTIGICYLEWLDYFNFEVQGKTYKCLLLNSEITIKNGLEENLYTEMLEENEGEYISSPKTNNTSIFDEIIVKKNVVSNGERLVSLKDIYPIGSIYGTSQNVNPKEILGFGNWTRISTSPYYSWRRDED